MKRKTEQILDYLRENSSATNKEIAEALEFERDFVTKQISLFKARGWIAVSHTDGKRTIQVKKEDPNSMIEYKKEIYTEMLPLFLYDFEQATNIQDRSLVAKLIFRVMDNL